MKKLASVIMIALFGFWATTASAQYQKGQMDLNIGVGLGSTFVTGTSSLPPVSVALDFGINDNVSLGGFAGYSSSSQDLGIAKWSFTYIIVGARGAYHKEFVENLDTYAGVLLGYNIASAKWEGTGLELPSPSVGGIAYAGFAGARYHFGDSFGVFAEVGYGIALLTAGITMKF